MDRIAIKNVYAFGRHGNDPGERDQPQRLEIDVAFDMDLRAAERSDDLRDTVDYAAIHEAVVRIVETTSFALLERLAGEILASLFEDRRVASATLTIAKPQLLEGATPSVQLSRPNPNYRAPA